MRPRLHWAGRAWLLLTLAVLLLLPLRGAAQELTLTVELASFDTEEWPLAQAVVTVLGSDGRPLANLTEEQFRAQLNGSAMPVTAVIAGVDSSLGIAVVLALDVSGSMGGGALAQAKAAAHRFLEGLGPQDSVAVVAFGDTVVSLLAFTQDRAAAGAAIDSLTPGGNTALYDATADSVRLAADSGNSRLAVVLLTDGVDDGSQISRADALATAETLAVPVFAIGLGTNLDRAYLQELATVSGGRFAETPSAQGLAQLYEEAAELLRGQYILTLNGAGLSLGEAKAVTLRVDVTAGERTGGGERTFAPKGPAVTLSEVEPGERLEAERTIIAQVISAEPVISVTFLVDGEPVLELTEPPYQFSFDPAAVADGEHTLRVEVVTEGGGFATTALVVQTGAGEPSTSPGEEEAAGGAGNLVIILAAGLVLVAAIGGALLLYLLRRRGGGGARGPSGEKPPPINLGRIHRPKMPQPLKRDKPPPEREEPTPVREMTGEPVGQLLVTSGPLEGQTFPVSNAAASIGSGHRCLIRLVDETEEEEIAPEQARFWVRDGQLMVHELMRLGVNGPLGGVWSILHPGEAFTIGRSSFKFELMGDQATEPTEEPERPQEIPNILRDAKDGSDGSSKETAASAEDSAEPETLPAQPGAAAAADGHGDPQDAAAADGHGDPQGAAPDLRRPPDAQPEG
jgi:VWFA-related protein